MRLPRLQFSMRWLLALPVLAALGIVLVSLSMPPRRSLVRKGVTLRFRVVDAENRKPISLARVVIENLTLGSALGPDTEAVTTQDGSARLRHPFLSLEERRGILVWGPTFFQGPWIDVSSEGYEPWTTPLSDLIGDRSSQTFGAPPEALIALRRERPHATSLADFVGSYIFSDGFVYREIRIEKTGDYHFRYGDDTDNHLESIGKCSLVHGKLRLTPDRPFSEELNYFLGNDLVPLRWADRTYLVPDRQRLDFCNAVNRGHGTRYMRNGDFLRQDPDREIQPSSAPEVPRAWARYLLPGVLKGAITRVIPGACAELNLGARDGVRAGMVFDTRSSVPWSRSDVLVIAVQDHDCLVVIPERQQSYLSKLFGQSGNMLTLGQKVVSRRASDP